MTEDEKIKIEPKFNHAMSLWQNNKPLEAIEILKNLDEEFPRQPTILAMIGAIYFALKDWSNSLIFYDRTVELAPKSELASVALFHCLWRHERFDKALLEANRYTKLNGFSAEYALIFDDLDNDESFQIFNGKNQIE